MKRAKIYAAIGIAILGLCFSSNSMASEEKDAQALTAARTWLTLVDDDEFGGAEWLRGYLLCSA